MEQWETLTVQFNSQGQRVRQPREPLGFADGNQAQRPSKVLVGICYTHTIHQLNVQSLCEQLSNFITMGIAIISATSVPRQSTASPSVRAIFRSPSSVPVYTVEQAGPQKGGAPGAADRKHVCPQQAKSHFLHAEVQLQLVSGNLRAAVLHKSVSGLAVNREPGAAHSTTLAALWAGILPGCEAIAVHIESTHSRS